MTTVKRERESPIELHRKKKIIACCYVEVINRIKNDTGITESLK
jgi:hypothetical protein